MLLLDRRPPERKTLEVWFMQHTSRTNDPLLGRKSYRSDQRTIFVWDDDGGNYEALTCTQAVKQSKLGQDMKFLSQFLNMIRPGVVDTEDALQLRKHRAKDVLSTLLPVPLLLLIDGYHELTVEIEDCFRAHGIEPSKLQNKIPYPLLRAPCTQENLLELVQKNYPLPFGFAIWKSDGDGDDVQTDYKFFVLPYYLNMAPIDYKKLLLLNTRHCFTDDERALAHLAVPGILSALILSALRLRSMQNNQQPLDPCSGRFWSIFYQASCGAREACQKEESNNLVIRW